MTFFNSNNASVFAKTVLVTALAAASVQPAFAADPSLIDRAGKAVTDFAKDRILDVANAAVEGGTEFATDTAATLAGGANDIKGSLLSGKSSTQISGNVNIQVEAGDITSTASGENSVSTIDIGTISGSQLKDVDIKVKVGNVTSTASGKDSASIIGIGTIASSKIGGTTNIEVEAQDVSSIASGDNSTSIVKLGSIENADISGNATIKVKVGNVTSAATAKGAFSSIRVGSIY